MDEVVTARDGETLVDMARRVYHLSPAVRPVRVAAIVASYTHSNKVTVGSAVGQPLPPSAKITFPPWKVVLTRMQGTASVSSAKPSGAGAGLAAPIQLRRDHDKDTLVRTLARLAASKTQLPFEDGLACAITASEGTALFSCSPLDAGALIIAARAWLTKEKQAGRASEAVERFSAAMRKRFDEEALAESARRKQRLLRALEASEDDPPLTDEPSRAFAGVDAARLLELLRASGATYAPRVLVAIVDRVLRAWGIHGGEWAEIFLDGREDDATPFDHFVSRFDAEASDGPLAAWLWQRASAPSDRDGPAIGAVAELLDDLATNAATAPSACLRQHGIEMARRMRGAGFLAKDAERAFLAGRNFVNVRKDTREQIDRTLALQVSQTSLRLAVLGAFLGRHGTRIPSMTPKDIDEALAALAQART